MVTPSDEREAAGPAAVGGNVASSSASQAASAPGTVDEYIGSRLRKAYDAVAQEPVPDRFLQLIAALDKP